MEMNVDFACTVATLILVDDEIAVTSEKIMALLKTANVEVEPIWPKIYAEKLGPNVKDLITNVSCSAGAAAPVAAASAAGAPAAAAAAEAKEEKKEEKEEEEEDDDMGFGLFD